ncbi:protein mono-ADP-ribosyltransferase PARP9 [Leptodactylus fuscus]|uniref:protein mono-ADP-ribosyltransferase PARP9 n=1 Tax=Leptodactylus fuscus TaxID=238119 RepID=UPI003F4EFA2F
MALVRKVLVPEDVYRVLVSCESDINDLFIRRFQCTAEVTGPRIGAGSAPEKVYEKRLLQGPQISVWRDDLTRQDVDVVVNAANEYLDHIGGLAYALVEAGGQQINRESEDWIKQNGRLSVGAIAVTSAGRLPSRRIVHVVGPRWSTGVEDKCKAQLQEAIRNVLRSVMLQTDVHSVAIPAVSSGIFGFPLDLCADIIVRTVHTVCSSEDKGRLREIRLVNHDDKTVGAMRAACEKILGQSDTLSGAMSSPAQTRQWHQETSPQMVLSGTINGLNLHLKMGQIEDEKVCVTSAYG